VESDWGDPRSAGVDRVGLWEEEERKQGWIVLGVGACRWKRGDDVGSVCASTSTIAFSCTTNPATAITIAFSFSNAKSYTEFGLLSK
jgi:hypothetical protein